MTGSIYVKVQERMAEIGKPVNYPFGQGDASWAFFEAGFIMLTRQDDPKSLLFYPGKSEYPVFEMLPHRE